MKLSLRDFFWLTALVAMGLGWWLDHCRQAVELERLGWADAMLQVRNVKHE